MQAKSERRSCSLPIAGEHKPAGCIYHILVSQTSTCLHDYSADPTMLRPMYRVAARQARCRPTRNIQALTRCSFSTMRHPLLQLSSSVAQMPTFLPADKFQLLSDKEKASNEDQLFSDEVQAVKDWWASDRYKGIQRPYTPEDVVSKRGALQQIYPSSLMARKLFNLFKERESQGLPVHTSGLSCIDHGNMLTSCQWGPLILYR